MKNIKHIRKMFKISILIMGAVFSFFIGTAFYGILTVGKFVAVEPIMPVATLEFIISIVGTIGMSCLVLNELKLTKFRWLK